MEFILSHFSDLKVQSHYLRVVLRVSTVTIINSKRHLRGWISPSSRASLWKATSPCGAAYLSATAQARSGFSHAKVLLKINEWNISQPSSRKLRKLQKTVLWTEVFIDLFVCWPNIPFPFPFGKPIGNKRQEKKLKERNCKTWEVFWWRYHLHQICAGHWELLQMLLSLGCIKIYKVHF